MSAFVALLSRDGHPVDQGDAWAMLQAVPHRGLDGMDVRALPEHGLVLGHALTIVTAEDRHDRQPRASRHTGSVIVADVRLDNRDDLVRQMTVTVDQDASDAEIILDAYDLWGEDAFARILGDFACVIWDQRRRRLVCARDTSGQRELFYRVDRGQFVAASEIHQLLQDPEVPMRPNRNRILDALAPIHAFRNEKDWQETFFDGIWAVPAGHILTVDRSALHLRPYWEFAKPEPIRYRHHEEYAEHFRSLFFNVVRAQTRSMYPLAAFLSGGLDSSSIVCTARTLARSGQAADRGFIGINAAFDQLECDERPFLEATQRMYDLDVRYVEAGAHDGRLNPLPAGFVPAPNMGVPAVRNAMFSEVYHSGARVVLTGDVADACVYGSRSVFHSLLRGLHLRESRRHWSAYRRDIQEPWGATLFFGSFWPQLPTQVQARLLPLYLRWARRKYDHLLLPWWLTDPVRAEASRRHWEASRREATTRLFSATEREAEYRLLYPPEIARHPSPWPVEMRRPFADRRLHQFLLAVPPEQKFSPDPRTNSFYAGSKRLLRTAMMGVLPEEIRTRTNKTFFTSSVGSEINHQWGALEAAFGPGAKSQAAAHGYIQQDRFWSRLGELRANPDQSETLYAMQIVNLENWLRLFLVERSQAVRLAVPAQLRESLQGRAPVGGIA